MVHYGQLLLHTCNMCHAWLHVDFLPAGSVKILNTFDQHKCKSLFMHALLASLFPLSFALIPKCPEQYTCKFFAVENAALPHASWDLKIHVKTNFACNNEGIRMLEVCYNVFLRKQCDTMRLHDHNCRKLLFFHLFFPALLQTVCCSTQVSTWNLSFPRSVHF